MLCVLNSSALSLIARYTVYLVFEYIILLDKNYTKNFLFVSLPKLFIWHANKTHFHADCI